MPVPTVVGLQPHKAAVLVGALRRAASDLACVAWRVTAPLAAAGEPGDAPYRIGEAALFCDDAASSLQQVLDDVAGWFVTGRPDGLAGVDVWAAPFSVAFEDPGRAVAAAAEARALLDANVLDAGRGSGDAEESGGPAALLALLRTWQHDPVFGVELARQLDPDQLADLLLVEQEFVQAGRPLGGAAASDARRAVFAALATASRAEVLPFRFAAVLDALHPGASRTGSLGRDGDPVALAVYPAALLFGGETVWSTEFLLEAVQLLVVPLNHNGGAGQVARVVGGEDVRVPILRAVAADNDAARLVLSDHRFDELFAARNAYGDGGRALATVLRNGTDPAGGAAARDNMVAFVLWCGRRPDLPPVTRAALGGVAAPWVDSFRSTSRDGDPSATNPLAVLGDDARVSFLDYVAHDAEAAADLRAGELRWLTAHLYAVAGPGFDGRGVALAANVDQRVADAVSRGQVDRLEDENTRRVFDKRLWGWVVSLLSDGLPPVLSASVSITGGLVIDAYAPDGHDIAELVRVFPRLEDSDLAKLENLLLASLWLRRGEHAVFTDVAEPPTSVVVGEPPRLLTAPEMTAAQLRDFRDWLDGSGLRARAHFEQLTVRQERGS